MQKITNWFTEKKMIVIGSAGVLVFLLSYFSKELGICSRGATYCGDCSDYIAIFSVYSFVVLYSVTLYHYLNQGVKKNFVRIFAVVFAVLFLLTIFAPYESGAFDGIPEKGPLTLSLVVLYFILATIYFVINIRNKR